MREGLGMRTRARREHSCPAAVGSPMAKRQTRRSISVKGITYQRLKDHCDATGVSVSSYLEELLEEKLAQAGVLATPERVAKVAAQAYPKRKPVEDEAEKYFTW